MVKSGLIEEQFNSEWSNFSTIYLLFQLFHCLIRLYIIMATLSQKVVQFHFNYVQRQFRHKQHAKIGTICKWQQIVSSSHNRAGRQHSWILCKFMLNDPEAGLILSKYNFNRLHLPAEYLTLLGSKYLKLKTRIQVQFFVSDRPMVF